MSEVTIDDVIPQVPGRPPPPRVTPDHGHIAVGGTILPNGRCPLLQVPRQGGGAICLPGLNRAGGPQLRGQAVGGLRLAVSPPGPRQARP